MLYYVHEQQMFICTIQHTLAYKLTCSRCDMYIYINVPYILMYDCCIISLFAETVLHIGQVPMLVTYIIMNTQCTGTFVVNHEMRPVNHLMKTLVSVIRNLIKRPQTNGRLVVEKSSYTYGHPNQIFYYCGLIPALQIPLLRSIYKIVGHWKSS